jgi:hypothetical protein
MCCFSRPVSHVGSTRIFARFLDGVNQCIVYEMTVSVSEELAMILPIPVVQPAEEDAVKFTDFSSYPGFFGDLAKAYPIPVESAYQGDSRNGPFAGTGKPLEVQKVGSFNASFVPTIKDFSRLDAQFRLDDAVWKSLPQYKDFGFAVFKLRKGSQYLHPMAFRFPSRTPGKIFFPTVHIHDGKVHEMEDFDHRLYAQAWKTAVIKGPQWEESEKNAGQFVNQMKSKDFIWGGGHLYKRDIVGQAKNEDTIAEARKLG